MYTIQDLSSETGLTVSFIRRCLKAFARLFEPHLKRGNFNQILLDVEGYVLFDKIKQLKQRELSLPEIQHYLEQEFPEKFSQFSSESSQQAGPSQTLTNPDQTHGYLEKIFELQQDRLNDRDRYLQDLQEKDARIHDLQRKVDALEGQMKGLPSGKTPADVMQDYETQRHATRDAEHRYTDLKRETEFRQREQQREQDYRLHEQRRLLEDLKTTPWYQHKRRKRLLAQLEELVSPKDNPDTGAHEN